MAQDRVSKSTLWGSKKDQPGKECEKSLPEATDSLVTRLTTKHTQCGELRMWRGWLGVEKEIKILLLKKQHLEGKSESPGSNHTSHATDGNLGKNNS